MSWTDVAGYIASGLVFVTFYMKGMVSLRLVALCSNVAFLAYGIALHLPPIVFLHGSLIPVNICRLAAAMQESGNTTITSLLTCLHRASVRRSQRKGEANH